MELFCYQAECGDALRIRYIGDDGKLHNIFLDSGYERTYRHVLRQEINSLIREGESIDLWIVSHIHDDHIGGAIKYIKSIEDNEIDDITSSWFYNPPRKYSVIKRKNKDDGISPAKSIRQGDILYDFLARKKKLPEYDITAELDCLDLFGLKIYILSPTSKTINQLREKYKDRSVFETNELAAISRAATFAGFDYDLKIDSFDLNQFKEDDSLENESSISVLFEYQDKRILWLADSHPSVIKDSLLKKGYSIAQPLACNYVVVSHHASKGNNSSYLYDMINCVNYIISSDGENKYYLPDKETLARIIRNSHRDIKIPYNLYFTYDTPNLNEIFLSDDEAVHRRWNFKTFYSDKKYLYFLL